MLQGAGWPEGWLYDPTFPLTLQPQVKPGTQPGYHQMETVTHLGTESPALLLEDREPSSPQLTSLRQDRPGPPASAALVKGSWPLVPATGDAGVGGVASGPDMGRGVLCGLHHHCPYGHSSS